ncbi:MAG: hypothetical protein E7335_11560 [Clostridiales bacterium]|nr:hypothetical protein [Clostridiales bacterium]
MKLLENMKSVSALMTAVSICQEDVILRSMDGSEEYNLKSALSQLISIAKLCEEHGGESEIICMNRMDESNLLRFFNELDKTNADFAI